MNIASENVLTGIAVVGLVIIGTAGVFHAVPSESASIVGNIASGLIGALSMRAVSKTAQLVAPQDPQTPPPAA